MRRPTVTGLGIASCWALLAFSATLDVPSRLWTLGLASTLYISISNAVRGPLWYQAYRLGRYVEREVTTESRKAIGATPVGRARR